MWPCGRVLHVRDVANTLPTAQTRRTRPQGRVLRVRDVANTPDKKMQHWSRVFLSGVSLHPSHHPSHCLGMANTPHMKMRPQCRVFVSGVSLHPYHSSHCPDTNNATPVSHFRVWDIPAPFPPPSTTQTGRTRPLGHILHVWGIPPWPRHGECDSGRILHVWVVSI